MTDMPAIANYYAHYFMNLLRHLLLKCLKVVHNISHFLDTCQIGQAQKKLKNLTHFAKQFENASIQNVHFSHIHKPQGQLASHTISAFFFQICIKVQFLKNLWEILFTKEVMLRCTTLRFLTQKESVNLFPEFHYFELKFSIIEDYLLYFFLEHTVRYSHLRKLFFIVVYR